MIYLVDGKRLKLPILNKPADAKELCWLPVSFKIKECKYMNIEIIANQFETRAGTLLRYFTGLCESSYKVPFAFKIYTSV